MSIEMPLTGADTRSEVDLPEVDEVLAGALVYQGAQGVRALGLLRDARRILSGAGGLEQPGEIVEACVRSAADSLLKLPGAPKDSVGLQTAAKGLLAAVDAACPATDSAAAAGAGWGRIRDTAEVLRHEIRNPGGHRRRQARGIAEQLMGLRLGAAQDEALNVWGRLYSEASGTLHGARTDEGRPARLYTEFIGAARDLLVPLSERAARVLQLTAHQQPGQAEALEIVGWADPRAEAYFFRSGPAVAWLEVLEEHAPHLLLADEAAGVWPAAPFLQHLAATAPQDAAGWLAGHAAELAAAGPYVLAALLRLASAGVLTPAGVRQMLPHVLVPARAGEPAEQASMSRRLVAGWAGTLPMPERDGDWVRVAEALLKEAVDLGHAGYRAYRDEHRRARAEQRPLPELTEVLDREWAARLPAHDITGLLRELVVTVHAAAGDSPFGWDRAVRNALAGLLRDDIKAPDRRPWPEFVDLDEVRVLDETVFLGPVLDMGSLLARAALDLAAADAAAGVPLAERLRAWPRIEAANLGVHDRVLAAHLAAHPPPPDTGPGDEEAEEWWNRAVEATVRLLAASPVPEGARLAALVLDTCPPGRAAGLQQRVREALGQAPSGAEVDRLLSAAAGWPGPVEAGGAVDPLASWLRVWVWSPVLPADVLAGYGPLLAALRRARPGGPPGPRVAARPRPRHHTATTLEDLRELAAAAGPLAAAAALAAAEDAGASGYATVLQRLVGADPGAWTADVPAVLGELARPELGAFYLAAAAQHPGDFPVGAAGAVLAALALTRALPAPAGPHVPDAADCASRAWSGLLRHVWRTRGDLGGDLPAVLDLLHTLAAPLTRPATPTPAGAATTVTSTTGGGSAGEEEGGRPARLVDTHAAVRALDCLLDYAASRATTESEMPGDVLDLLAGVLAARGGDEAVAAAIGAHLPVLHRFAAAFTDAHHAELYALIPGRPSPAAAWLRERRGPSLDPPLLAALDRGQLLTALREEPSGAIAFRVAHALVTGHGDLLGNPVAAWRELAAGPGGTEAASGFLGYLALFTAMGPLDRTTSDTEQVWWTAALDAELPPGALAGAGYFATALPDDAWLPLARRSAAHTPAQEDAGKVAERAAAHPGNSDALLLAAHLLTRPAPGGEHDLDVRRHARTLLHAAEALPTPDRPDHVQRLRRALDE